MIDATHLDGELLQLEEGERLPMGGGGDSTSLSTDPIGRASAEEVGARHRCQMTRVIVTGRIVGTTPRSLSSSYSPPSHYAPSF